MRTFEAFSGYFDAEDWCVWICKDGNKVARLNPQLSVLNKSPTGYGWGYGGSGSAQLAFALLAAVIGVERAQEPFLYQNFKFDVIAKLDQKHGWKLTENEIRAWVDKIEKTRGNKQGVQ